MTFKDADHMGRRLKCNKGVYKWPIQFYSNLRVFTDL